MLLLCLLHWLIIFLHHLVDSHSAIVSHRFRLSHFSFVCSYRVIIKFNKNIFFLLFCLPELFFSLIILMNIMSFLSYNSLYNNIVEVFFCILICPRLFPSCFFCFCFVFSSWYVYDIVFGPLLLDRFATVDRRQKTLACHVSKQTHKVEQVS